MVLKEQTISVLPSTKELHYDSISYLDIVVKDDFEVFSRKLKKIAINDEDNKNANNWLCTIPLKTDNTDNVIVKYKQISDFIYLIEFNISISNKEYKPHEYEKKILEDHPKYFIAERFFPLSSERNIYDYFQAELSKISTSKFIKKYRLPIFTKTIIDESNIKSLLEENYQFDLQ